MKVVGSLYSVALFASFGFLLYDHYEYQNKPTPEWVTVLRNVAIAMVILLILMAAWVTWDWIRFAQKEKKFDRSYQFLGALGVGMTLAYFMASGFWLYSHFAFAGDENQMSSVTNALTQSSMYYVIVMTFLIVAMSCSQNPYGCGQILQALISMAG